MSTVRDHHALPCGVVKNQYFQNFWEGGGHKKSALCTLLGYPAFDNVGDSGRPLTRADQQWLR